MGAARDFVGVLKEHQKKNDLKAYTNSAAKLTEYGKRIRIFDNFRTLAPADILEKMALTFPVILGQYSPEGMKQFAESIINLSRDMLLDQSYQIRKDVIEFLKWTTYYKPEHTVDIVCAHVHGIMQDIIFRNLTIVPQNAAYQIALAYFNKNYREWVKQSFPNNDSKLIVTSLTVAGILASGIFAAAVFKHATAKPADAKLAADHKSLPPVPPA